MSQGLEVDGLVDNPQALSFEALAGLPGQIADVSELVPGRQGGAVKLSAVVGASQPQDSGKYITLQAEDWAASIPLEAVADHALLVYRLGDAPLPSTQGGPIRFLIPDVSACGTDEVDECASVKYVQRITITAEKGQDTRPMSRFQHVELHTHE
ncbi:MAG: DMSO/TMAO reductase YedYZ, molybdopterin-dependent catalytic subunit [Chloroflexi bacterium]|jgi:DMSO/TMAO reductase YedYZ molybdopterin-dependent catalytic subunit|nr:MAG: DMSO/TMAO reductase YedYZ, molybdopterin-dependent catalytic subunit [Chloroflexota bacterium]